MRIWNFLIIYSCLSDADKKGLEDENDTAVDENQDNEHTVFLKDVLPKEEYKVVEEEQKKTKMEEKLKVPTQKLGLGVSQSSKDCRYLDQREFL